MPRLLALALLCTGMVGVPAQERVTKSDTELKRVSAEDWPWWRGPDRNGEARATPAPPLKWSDTDNIRWQAAVPGRGHGSPIVVGEQVFLASADEEKQIQSLLCYHRDSGKLLWQTEVHQGNFSTKGLNPKSTHASSTPACDGKRVFINFLNDGGLYTTALDRDGKKLWQTKVTDYVLHQGFGSSPAVYESLLLVSADNKGSGAVAALDRATGTIVWKKPRPKSPNYASPIVLKVAGREQLILIGCDLVTSLDPRTGETIWEIKGATTECVTSTVTDGVHIYTSGGYPRSHLAAVRADGSGKIVWDIPRGLYVPSPLMREGHLYAVTDAGVACCLRSDSGKEIWKDRLEGNFSASPVLVGDRIYATNESGRTFVFRATTKGLEVLADNPLGRETMASAAICGGRVYLRGVALDKTRRQEMLYCVGK